MFDFWDRTGVVLKFGFVNGHIGGVGKEAADTLANQGRLLSETIQNRERVQNWRGEREIAIEEETSRYRLT